MVRWWSFAVLASMAYAGTALAQSYPSRPIRLIVPFAPGGGNDIIGRQVGAKVAEALQQQVVIDNRGGAGGAIGMELAATAPPDGYTIVLGHVGTLAANPTMDPKTRYDPVRDFAPLSVVANLPAVMAVHPSLGVTTVSQFLTLARSKPGALSYGSGGSGGVNHLATEYLKLLTKIDLIHVPYRSAGLATTDLLAGQIAMVMPAVPVVLPHVRAGKLRALGVSSESRLAIAPEIPTIAESGVPEFKVSQWYGLLAPAKTPQPIVSRLHAAIVKASASADLKERMANEGAQVTSTTPQEFQTLIKSEIKRWAPVIKAAGLQQ